MKQLLILIICLPTLLTAQINESDTLNLKASISLTGLYQGGNVESLIFRAKSDLSIHPFKKWVFKNQSSYVYQEFGNVKADEDILTLNFLYFNPTEKIYPFVLGFASTNFRREIDLRYLIGAGVSFQILDQNTNWLKCSISSEYELTKFSEMDFNYSEYDGQESINTLRATLWLNGKYTLITNKLIITHESYFQPSLANSNNFRWQADLGIELPIFKYFNFKVNYRHTFESIVIESQEQEDRFLTFGVTLKNF